MKNRLKGTILIIVSCLIFVSAGTIEASEWYVGAHAGVNIPQDLSDVGSRDGIGGVSLSDLALNTSVAFGGKAGLFFPKNYDWLGIEVEAYSSTPNIQQQTVSGSSNGVVSGARLRVITLAFNVLARYPSKHIQPYVGAGLGIFFAKATDRGVAQSDTSPGINAQAGVRYFFAESLAAFTEYKFNYSEIQFTKSLPNGVRAPLEGDYISNLFIGGISFHFNGPS